MDNSTDSSPLLLTPLPTSFLHREPVQRLSGQELVQTGGRVPSGQDIRVAMTSCATRHNVECLSIFPEEQGALEMNSW